MNTKCEKCNTEYGLRKRCYKCESFSKWVPKPWLEKSGYFRIRLPNRGRVVYFHRWIVEQHLGRSLVWPEVVHHIDGNKTNNKIENLELTTAKDHLSHHKKGTNKAKKGWSHEYYSCVICASSDKKHRANGLCSICYSRKYELTRPKRIK